MKDKRNLIIIILVSLLIISIIMIILLMNKKEDVLKEMSGTVIISDKNYIILNSKNSDYLISNIKGVYHIGDEVKITYLENNLDKKEEPYKVKIEDEELINVYEEEKKDSNEANINSSSSNNSPINNSDDLENNNSMTNSNSDNTANTQTQANPSTNYENVDSIILNYANDLKSESDKTSISQTLKSGFVTVVDFIFYNGAIKGHTFKELSDSAKLKLLSIVLYLDNKIDKYFPGYKESISNTASKTYTNIKAQVIESYLVITTTVCKSNENLCNSAKNGFQDIKKNFGLTWNLIKEIAGDGLANLKNWYEIWKES